MSAEHVLDSSVAAEHFFTVPDEIYVLVRAYVWLRFREFTAPATAAASGGGSTSGSGGGSSPTSSNQAAHRHRMFDQGGGTALGLAHKTITAWNEDTGAAIVLDMATNATHLDTKSAAGSHAHTVTVAAHDHTTPAHAHGLTYGIFRETMPGSIDVVVGVYHKPLTGGSWTLEGSVSGLTDTEELVDLTAIIDRAGLWRLTIQSAAGQPNGGRLTVDVTGAVLGAIQSS